MNELRGPLLKNGRKYMSEDIGCNILLGKNYKLITLK
jgi:hypothetical protein